jgi:recombination protein RecR
MQEYLEHLMSILGRLPGVGRRSTERIALRLVRDREKGLIGELISALQSVEAEVRLCSLCGSLTSATADPCRLCTDPRRQSRQLCVVEEPGDILLIEKSGAFHGRYHALMGKLSPMRGEGPRQLRLESLMRRVREEEIEEVILALNTDMESDATASYLHDLLQPTGARVSRLAYGIPAGSGIAYSDPVTLSRAIEGRRLL